MVNRLLHKVSVSDRIAVDTVQQLMVALNSLKSCQMAQYSKASASALPNRCANARLARLHGRQIGCQARQWRHQLCPAISQAKDARRDYDLRQAEAGLSHHEAIMAQVGYLFADFRSWSRNLPPVGVAASELEF